MRNAIEKTIQNLMKAIFFIVVFLVAYFTVFTNVYSMEYVTQVKVVYGILPIPFLVFIIFVIFQSQIINYLIKHKKYFNIFFYIYLVVVGFVILKFANAPITDAALCLKFSNNLDLLFTNNYSQYHYLIQNIHNLGIILFDSLFSAFSQVSLLRILNVLMIMGIYFLLETTFLSELKGKVLFKVIAMFWLPLIFLVPLIYGWIYGLFFLCLGLFFFKKYNETNDLINLLYALLNFVICIFLKQNYMIVLVAIIIVACVNRVNNKIWVSLSLILSLILGMKLPSFIAHNIFSFPSNSSQPVSLYLAMANYRTDYESLPGWVDGYHAKIYSEIVEKDGYVNAERVANKIAANLIKENLAKGLNDIPSLFRFYKNKLLTGWGSKDFGLLNEFQYSLKSLNLKTNHFITSLLLIINLGLYMIVIGTLLWSVKCLKSNAYTIYDQILAIAFIGFFFFYLISEMQSRYLICTITLMLNDIPSLFRFYKNKLLTGWGSKDFGLLNEFQYSLKSLNLKSNSYIISDQILAIAFIGFFFFYLISEMQSRYLICTITLMLPLAAKGLTSIELNLKKSQNKTLLIALIVLPLVFNTRNLRFNPVVKASDKEEMVSISIAEPFYYEFYIDKETNIDSISIKLDGSGDEDVLSFSIYDNTRDKLIVNALYNGPSIESYWYNNFDFEQVELEPGNYTLILQSKNNSIKLLVDYNNLPYCEIGLMAKKITTISDIRYISPNNFN